MTPSCPMCCTRLVKPTDLKDGEHVLCPVCEDILIWTNEPPIGNDGRDYCRNFYQPSEDMRSHIKTVGGHLRTMTRYRRSVSK
jgi:hypothetical protein